MPLVKNDEKVSEAEYLKGELTSEIKHEFIDGYVYAMAGASKNHYRITKNIVYGLENDLRHKKSPCEVFSSDIKARGSEQTTKYFYPDALVTCDPDDNESEYYVNSPIIIVEILSDSTRKYDKGQKKLAYFNILTLQEYIIVEQDYCEVEVFRKNEHWKSTIYFLGDDIMLDSIGITLSVEDIYLRVKNKDTINL
jgi:Uma2 family endonuclease